MRIEVYLSKGKEEEIVKAELYIDGSRPQEAMVGEFSQKKIPTLLRNFHKELEAMGVTDIEVEVMNKGLEDKLYEQIEGQILAVLNSRKAVLPC